MRVLVTGSAGMLGQDLVMEFQRRGHEAVGIDLDDLDLTSPEQVASLGRGGMGRFDWVANCAAYTAVDRAEEEQEAAYRVNSLAPGLLAEATARLGARLMHLSTDFVFDGEADHPYTESDEPRPLGVYGQTKLQGEQNVLHAAPDSVVVRTAWLYGPLGKSFPRTILSAWLAGKPLKVVADQTGSPTYTGDLARVLVDLAELQPMAGVIHAAGPTEAHWHELAVRVCETYRDRVLKDGREVAIEPIRTSDWPTPARRPARSTLDTSRLTKMGVEPMRPLGPALAEFVDRLHARGGP